METSLQMTNRLKLLLKHGLMDRRKNSFFQGINSMAEKSQKCTDVIRDCIEKYHYVWKFVVLFYIRVAKLFERPSYIAVLPWAASENNKSCFLCFLFFKVNDWNIFYGWRKIELSLLSSESSRYRVWSQGVTSLLHKCQPPSPLLDNIRDMVIVWRLRGNIIRAALCWVVWRNVHSQQHTHMSSSYRFSRLRLSHWDLYAMHRGGCLELYYCNMVEWCWWDSGLIWKTNWFLSVLWHCWFGHMTCKNRPRYDL